VIDLHCHLLPGIDDGPHDRQEALALAQAQVAWGISQVVCTPHVMHSYPANRAAMIADATDELRRELASAGVDLQIHTGGEVALARALELDDDELSALHLGGSEWLLVEPPLSSDVPRLEQLVMGLQHRGHRILIAHPERCAAFHHDPGLLATLVKQGALAQITAGSLSGAFGRTVARLATAMVAENLVHVIASDAHDARRRPPGLAEPLAEAGLSWLTEWACVAVPEAMLAGEAIPPRPSAPPARRRFLSRR
jgi:protein-tyrosine phosphatase